MSKIKSRLLAADIGGTKSWLCLYDKKHESNQIVLFEKIYQSQHFTNATKLIERFLQDANAQDIKISHMCLALPGIVTEQYARLTNLEWTLDAKDLRSRFSAESVTFMNDFEAAALGVSTLASKDYITLNDAQSQDKAIKVVTGAGTGLGLAWLNYEKGRYFANASEGGHVDFAPVTKQQISLLEELMSHHSHVSFERLLSGEGLETIYHFLNQSKQDKTKANEITKIALMGNALADEALKLFVANLRCLHRKSCYAIQTSRWNLYCGWNCIENFTMDAIKVFY